MSEKYNTESEVIIYVPTSHVTGHQADMLSIQLLHDRWEQTPSQPHTCLVLLASCLSLVRRANTDNRAVGTGDPPPGSSTARTSPSTRSPARTSRCASPTSCPAVATRWRWFPTVRTGGVTSSPWPRPPAPPPWSGLTSANTPSPSYSVRILASLLSPYNICYVHILYISTLSQI